MTELLYGQPPLTARLEPWMDRVLADTTLCQELITTHGSPVNLHDFSALKRNTEQLREAATRHEVDLEVFFARKANKTIGAMDHAVSAGCGIDVASLNELDQCLRRGVDPARIIVSAAVKSAALLRLALEHRVVISVDHRDELEDLLQVAASLGVTASVALRLASANTELPPTRFGLRARQWLELLGAHEGLQRLEIAGLHFHLNGYSAPARVAVLAESMELVDALVEQGHAPGFIDIGGGIPMSYLDSAEQWKDFWKALAEQPPGGEQLTWKSDPLGTVGPAQGHGVYPYHQDLIRGPWLETILAAHPSAYGGSIAEMLNQRKLTLRCEPGRSLLDGCGLTLASVAFTKERSDGEKLVGLHMNRTQCRSTSADFMLDPILIHAGAPRIPRREFSGFLVGAYCIEDELILRRRFCFSQGATAGDLIAIPNTAGYLMHIVESASHQLPLALNLLWDGSNWGLDEIEERVLRS